MNVERKLRQALEQARKELVLCVENSNRFVNTRPLEPGKVKKPMSKDQLDALRARIAKSEEVKKLEQALSEYPSL